MISFTVPNCAWARELSASPPEVTVGAARPAAAPSSVVVAVVGHDVSWIPQARVVSGRLSPVMVLAATSCMPNVVPRPAPMTRWGSLRKHGETLVTVSASPPSGMGVPTPSNDTGRKDDWPTAASARRAWPPPLGERRPPVILAALTAPSAAAPRTVPPASIVPRRTAAPRAAEATGSAAGGPLPAADGRAADYEEEGEQEENGREIQRGSTCTTLPRYHVLDVLGDGGLGGGPTRRHQHPPLATRMPSGHVHRRARGRCGITLNLLYRRTA
jgi:hypothetical protein